MIDVSSCPDQTTLQRLLAGRVADDLAADLEQHLLHCPHCCKRVRELPSLDAAAGVRAARAAVDLSDEQAVIEVAERVATLRLPADSAPFTDTVAAGDENTADGWDFRGVLDPPQAEGELGRFGDYRVLRLLGAGGMGLVWEAEDPQLRRHVALKVMKPSLATQAEHRERFLREARAAAAIDHSHIVTVYQVGEHRGAPFLAMQLLRGETLHDLLQREHRLPQAECLRIGRQMAEALAVAHRRGLIHRDVKPANTWLESDGGWVKLVDFGLAHAVEDDTHLTQTGTILGTPAFMSPEQARGETVSARSDLFSLGAVLYRMTTGAGPFQGPSTLAVLTSLALHKPEAPRQLNADVLPDFSDLIMRLLAKDPADRPQSAEAVVEALREIEAKVAPTQVAPTLQSSSDTPWRRIAVAEGDRLALPSRSAGATLSLPSGSAGATRRPRWPWIAAAGAVALLLAGIHIIIRDKDGNIIGKGTYRDGVSAEVIHDGAETKPADGGAIGVAATPRGGESVAAGDRLSPPPRSVAATLPEPPPLDDWLTGRKLLTVSQDGKGQFKTIQAALDALRPGQAVEVLDRGPYRETLSVSDVRDAGLVSRVDTVVEFTAKREPRWDKDPANDQSFGALRTFRLHGFTFTAGELTDRPADMGWIVFGMNGDLVIENCRFADQRPKSGGLLIYWYATTTRGAVCHVRQCLFETTATINVTGGERRPAAILEHNWFRDRGLTIHGPGKQVIVRHNVFDGENPYGLSLLQTEHLGRLEIYNNTFLSRIFAHDNLPPTGVVLRNNLLLFSEGLVAGPAAAASLPAAAKGWEVGNNEYAAAPALANELPKTAGDFVATPKFLSDDRGARDYLRIAADSDEAHRGAEGEMPVYLGALPPGPAPKEGDWFTRWIESAKVDPALRDGSAKVDPALRDGSPSRSPTATASPPRSVAATLPSPPRSVGATLPSPPPLDEWLRGRKLLTVSQDGKADFKMIQAALDAVEPGQAVEILDRGPYRELLAVGEKNDFGLFSRAGAIIESGGTRKPTWDADPADFNNFSNLGRFRLSGISFAIKADDLKNMQFGASWFMLGANDDVLIENCRFTGGRRDGMEFLIYRRDDARPGAVCTVRGCQFESAINLGISDAKLRAVTVIERNWFRAPPQYMALHLGGPGELFLLRENVFDTGEKAAVVMFQTGGAQRLEVVNNTFMSPLSFGVVDLARTDLLCPREVVLRSNLFLQGITASPGMENALSAAAQRWESSGNAYAPMPGEPWRVRATAADIVTTPTFLSSDPSSRDYLRLASGSDEARRGAGGDLSRYLGALPPGPAPKEGDWLTRWIAK